MSKDTSKISRRNLLGATGVAIATSVAGCNQFKNNKTETPTQTESSPTTLSEFSYPNGFSKDGINLKTVFGKNSVMASLSSVQANFQQKIVTPNLTRQSRQEGKFSKKNKEFIVHSVSKAGKNQVREDYYFNKGTIYRRRKRPDSKATFDKQQYTFDVLGAYNLAQTRSLLKGLSITADRVEQMGGTTVAIYKADTKDFKSGGIFKNATDSDTLKSIKEGSLELAVDENGRLHKVNLQVTFINSNDEKITHNTVFTWSNYESVSITKPKWVKSASFETSTPKSLAEVDFTEKAGESVTITVTDIKVDAVGVYIGQQKVHTFTESGKTTIPASEYTTSDGKVQTITVVGGNKNEKPQVIRRYTPNQPAGSTATPTPTPTNTSG